MSAQIGQTEKEYPCFGKEWDKDAVECAGGPDPTFLSKRGDHVHDRCLLYSSCGARTQMAKGAALIPPQNLLQQRPLAIPGMAAMPPQAPPNPAQWFQSRANAVIPRPPVPPPQVVQAQQVHPSYYQYPQGPPMPLMPQAPPAGYYPAPQYQLNYMMPGYLSQPEVRQPGESMWAVLGREMLRAILKSLGHTLAHSLDTNVLGPRSN